MRNTRAPCGALLLCLAACSVDTTLAEAHREVGAPPQTVTPMTGAMDSGSSLDASPDTASAEPRPDAGVGDPHDSGAVEVPAGPDASLPPVPCVEGRLIPAPDGCNTCECVAESWTCFQNACSRIDVACVPGSSQLAADGCNECVCDGILGWLCTFHDACEFLPGGEYCIAGENIDGCDCACVNSRFECSCPDWEDDPCTPATRSVDLDACNICECDATLNLICSDLSWCR